MNLRAMREAAGMKLQDAVDILKADEPRMDKPLLSKCENNIVRLKAIHIRMLKAAYAAKCPTILISAIKGAESKECYKLTVRLPRDVATGINGKVKTCGYLGVTDWLMEMVRQLNSEYDMIEQTKEENKK